MGLTLPPKIILEIEISGYYVEEGETAEDIEVAMQLATEDVGVVLAHYSGDDPALIVKAMDGRIVGYRIAPAHREVSP